MNSILSAGRKGEIMLCVWCKIDWEWNWQHIYAWVYRKFSSRQRISEICWGLLVKVFVLVVGFQRIFWIQEFSNSNCWCSRATEGFWSSTRGSFTLKKSICCVSKSNFFELDDFTRIWAFRTRVLQSEQRVLLEFDFSDCRFANSTCFGLKFFSELDVPLERYEIQAFRTRFLQFECSQTFRIEAPELPSDGSPLKWTFRTAGFRSQIFPD